ncbi:arginine deiminase [Aeromicrobium chenweiae]|uniref:Arginine deiminase n=1 Tax=Aeromicrobium chenweiae TaxID=2079793 RepID=A0A2S0WHP3_9ACTN|nr:arginine deiminase [Aeromicrobium chenweiae]AWB90804.1 arginine deiminase [Aeromicrobium chenweiae]TGN31067.1 arginine deiminase [Aeromicrobium chenweiae]
MTLGADSEVGRLRTVMLHRPGAELGRLTPRNNDQLLFDGIPWLGRAQDEHDAFAQALRDHSVEVLYLTELLTTTLEIEAAREEIIASTLKDLFVGPSLQSWIESHLHAADPGKLAELLMAGLRNDEVRVDGSVANHLMQPEDFLINPLPNLLFTRDSSVWLRDRVAVTSLAMPARARETQLTGLIYRHHPRFAGTPVVHGPHLEHLEGGDVLELAPGVIAVGIGERTTPAGLERFARQVLTEDLARTVLAVPIAQERATMHLDTIVTMVDVDTVVIYPNMADNLRAVPLTWEDGRFVLGQESSFFSAAAAAMGIDTLHQIDTGLDPVTAEREQWDDGNNTLAIDARLAVAYERNEQTNARLEEHGIEVIAISGDQLGSGRGGPRCMSCPIDRD